MPRDAVGARQPGPYALEDSDSASLAFPDILAIVILALHIFLGLILVGAVVSSPLLVFDLLWTMAYALVIVGIARDRGWARPLGVALTLAAWVIGWLTQGHFLSTTLVAFVLLVVATFAKANREYHENQRGS